MSGKIRASLSVFALSAATLAPMRLAQANVNVGPGVPCGAPGVVNEAALGPANFVIRLTDNTGHGIGPFVDDAGGVWPMTVAGAVGADGVARAQAMFGGDKNGRVCDAVNETVRPKQNGGGGGGNNGGDDEESDLYIESVYLDRSDNKAKLEGFFDRGERSHRQQHSGIYSRSLRGHKQQWQNRGGATTFTDW